MVSLEVSNNLNGKFYQLLTEGAALLEEDKIFLEHIKLSMGSIEVLGLIKDLKEEGNGLFKQKRFNEALEKYGYAGVILTGFGVHDEGFAKEAFDLAIALLLNFAACFGKICEYEQMGRVCTLVLEFDPENVKALFRRADAALGLGQKVVAYWDLLLAAQIAPNNKEVSKKLNQVMKLLPNSQGKNHEQEDTPVGLGAGLPPLEKQVNKVIEEEQRRMEEQCEIEQESSSKKQRLTKRDDSVRDNMDVVMEELSNINTTKLNAQRNDKERGDGQHKLDRGGEGKSGRRPDGKEMTTFRFAQRHRLGSFLSISRESYDFLKQGKVIKCFNSKMQALLTVRVVCRPNNCVTGMKTEQNELQESVLMDVGQDGIASNQNDRIGVADVDSKLWVRHGSKIKWKRRASLSVCIHSRKIRKLGHIKEGYGKGNGTSSGQKSKKLKQQQSQADRQQGRTAVTLGVDIGKFRFSATKKGNYRGVKYQAYRAIIKRRGIKKQLCRGKLQLIGQKRKRMPHCALEHLHASKLKVLRSLCQDTEDNCNDAIVSSGYVGSVSSACMSSVVVSSKGVKST